MFDVQFQMKFMKVQKDSVIYSSARACLALSVKQFGIMDLLISYAVIITAGNAGNSFDWSLQSKWIVLQPHSSLWARMN